jgi:hypothetical protein
VPRRAACATARLSLSQLRDHFGVSRDTLAEWLWNEPTPDWTRRPNAKDELRAQVVQLRTEGRSVPEIAGERGVAKSTAWQWVKHLPLNPTAEQGAERRRRHAQHMPDTHNPSTVRFNVGDSYRGCLVIYVPRSSRLYWKVEGVMRGIALATASPGGGTMSPADMT